MPPDSLVRRDAKGRLLPGSVMNPKGRPRTGLALAETIREVAGDQDTLRDLIRLALDVAMGRPVALDTEWLREAHAARVAGLPDPPVRGEVMRPNIAEMQRAWDFLATWGFRKPPQEVEISGPDQNGIQVDYDKLTESELDELEAGHARLRALHAKAAGILDIDGG